MKLIITDEARMDLIGIGDYIARHSPRRAISFIRELEDRCRSLPQMPYLYPLLPRREPSGIRRVVHGNYLIFYTVRDDQLYVVHILNGAMNYEELLFPGG